MQLIKLLLIIEDKKKSNYYAYNPILATVKSFVVGCRLQTTNRGRVWCILTGGGNIDMFLLVNKIK